MINNNINITCSEENSWLYFYCWHYSLYLGSTHNCYTLSTVGSTLYCWLYSLLLPAIHYLPKTLRYQ